MDQERTDDDITMRPVPPADLDELQRISRRTFVETFAATNTPADMDAYLADRLGTERLQAELADPGSTFRFAVLRGRTAGYLKVNTGRAQTELQEESALEIERIYVLEEFQGRKIGLLLLEEAFRIARDKGLRSVWLGVWERNTKAIAFYRKNGFAVFGQHVFKLGQDEQVDLLMRRPIDVWTGRQAPPLHIL